jgi:hypothetical protein
MTIETPYVLLIHGTWTNSPGWHSNASSSNFCSALNEELKTQGWADAVWRPGNEGSVEFNWNGSNKHEDRIAAGDLLADRLRLIGKHDPGARIHIVGHSHGCNVTLRAIENYLQELNHEILLVIRNLGRDDGGSIDIEAAVKEVFKSETSAVLEHSKGFFEELKTEISKMSGSNSREGIRRFLGSDLGHKLIERWLESPRNRLGRVVFLGPPFLRKIWAPRRKITNFAISAVDFFCAFLFTAVAFYPFCVIMWSLIWLFTAPLLWVFGYEFLRRPTLLPLNWSVWLLVPSAFLGAAMGVAIGVIAASASKRTNRNLYFDGVSLASGFFGREFHIKPIEALVIAAELLDEVLLGFSSEPIVYGALLPQIREFFHPKISWTLPPTPLGYERGISEQLWRLVIYAFRIITAVSWFMARPITILWERIWTRRLMQLISASAYGVQLHELDRALIVASSRLNEPKFFAERFWDVTKLLISADVARDHSGVHETKYSFLWDDDQFRSRRSASWIWRSIEPHQREIEKHYGRFPQSTQIGSEDQLTRGCIMLEERFSEAVGAVGLMHTAYQSSRAVIEATSRFIVSGDAPSTATSSNAFRDGAESSDQTD